MADRLEKGEEYLTLEALGNVFGNPFWVLLVYTLLDAREAGMFIQALVRGAVQEPKAASGLIRGV